MRGRKVKVLATANQATNGIIICTGRLSSVPDLLQGMQQQHRLPSMLPHPAGSPTAQPVVSPLPLNLLGVARNAPSPAADTIMAAAAAAAAQQNHQRLLLNYKAALSEYFY